MGAFLFQHPNHHRASVSIKRRSVIAPEELYNAASRVSHALECVLLYELEFDGQQPTRRVMFWLNTRAIVT